MTRGLRTAGIVVACLGALTACSAGAEPDAATRPTPADVVTRPSPTTPSEAGEADANASMRAETRDAWPAVMPVVQAYSDALLGDKPARAFALLSQRCRTETALDDLARSAMSAQQEYGKTRRIRFADVTQDGDTAVVRFDYTLRATNPTRQTWVFEHKRWKNDDC